MVNHDAIPQTSLEVNFCQGTICKKNKKKKRHPLNLKIINTSTKQILAS